MYDADFARWGLWLFPLTFSSQASLIHHLFNRPVSWPIVLNQIYENTTVIEDHSHHIYPQDFDIKLHVFFPFPTPPTFSSCDWSSLFLGVCEEKRREGVGGFFLLQINLSRMENQTGMENWKHLNEVQNILDATKGWQANTQEWCVCKGREPSMSYLVLWWLKQENQPKNKAKDRKALFQSLEVQEVNGSDT